MNNLLIGSITMFFVLSLLYLALLFSQKLSKRNMYYGVFIEEKYKQIELKSIDSYFKRSIFFVYLTSLALTGVLLYTINEQTIIIPIFLSLLGYIFCYYRAYKQVKAFKQLHPTSELSSKKMMIDPVFLEMRTQCKNRFTVLSLLPICIALGSILYLGMHYDQLPQQVPTHWGPTGKADAFAEKSFPTVFTPAFLSVLLSIFLLFTSRWIFESRARLNPENLEQSRQFAMTYLKASATSLVLLNCMISLLFFVISIGTVTNQALQAWILWAIVVGILLISGTLIYAYYKYGQQAFIKASTYGYSPEDEDAYWIAGMFYNNPNDPSIMVEKRYGVGWTLNIGHFIGKLIMLSLIILPIIVVIITILSGN